MTGDERSLRAVGRVREARERDSRIGAQLANRIVAQRLGELQRAEDALAAAPAFLAGSASAFLVSRQTLTAMAGAAHAAADRVDVGRVVATDALGRWQHDRTRMRAVEVLEEHRAERRLAGQRRDEARELDDVAGRAWLRRATEADRSA